MKPPLSYQIGATVIDKGHRQALKFEDEANYLAFVNRLGVGQALIVTIEEDKPHRAKTWEQCKYWFAVPVALVADHCGMTEQQTSHALLGECFGYIDGPTGKPVPVEPSVAALSVEKMTDLINWVLDWGPAALEIIIPPPDKQWKEHADRIKRELRGRVA